MIFKVYTALFCIYIYIYVIPILSCCKRTRQQTQKFTFGRDLSHFTNILTMFSHILLGLPCGNFRKVSSTNDSFRFLLPSIPATCVVNGSPLRFASQNTTTIYMNGAVRHNVTFFHFPSTVRPFWQYLSSFPCTVVSYLKLW
jgi:hypothetical protein